MKSLDDITLCAARFDFNSEFTEWCTRRHHCQRYQQFLSSPSDEPIKVSVTMGRPECPSYISAEPEPEQQYIIVTRSRHGLWQARRHVYYGKAFASAALEFVTAHEKKIITISLESGNETD